MILQIILMAFLLFFFLTRPSTNMGTTNHIQKPIMMDMIILHNNVGRWQFLSPAH